MSALHERPAVWDNQAKARPNYEAEPTTWLLIGLLSFSLGYYIKIFQEGLFVDITRNVPCLLAYCWALTPKICTPMLPASLIFPGGINFWPTRIPFENICWIFSYSIFFKWKLQHQFPEQPESGQNHPLMTRRPMTRNHGWVLQNALFVEI